MAPVQGLARIDIKRGYPERLGINWIRTEHEIETTPDIKSLAFRYHRALQIDIELIQLETVGPVSESNRAVETIGGITGIIRRSEIDPSSHPNPGILDCIRQLNGMKIPRHRTQQKTHSHQ